MEANEMFPFQFSTHYYDKWSALLDPQDIWKAVEKGILDPQDIWEAVEKGYIGPEDVTLNQTQREVLTRTHEKDQQALSIMFDEISCTTTAKKADQEDAWLSSAKKAEDAWFSAPCGVVSYSDNAGNYPSFQHLIDPPCDERYEKYSKQIEESEGFDIDDCPVGASIVPIFLERQTRNAEDCSKLAELAIAEYNKQPGNTNKYKFDKVVKANYRVCSGFVYYITFQVRELEQHKRPPAVRTFQARVYYKIPCSDPIKHAKVELCRPKKNPMIKVPQTYQDRNEIFRSVPHFWLKVFLGHQFLGGFLTDEDRKIFKYLTSIEVEDLKSGGYSITFNFNPNPYFEDTKLIKTLIFENGTTRMTATPIQWKEGAVNIPEQVGERSFLVNWFSDPCLEGEDMEKLHVKVAEMIKKDLWPNPVVYVHDEDLE